ncbi:MAG TPA: ABC transporter permease [Ohtaekwangia sp.]|uniref:ABC transporter permease n=1 Tax=Ohtaekwangia sp. TaxID=2066019 RepID=UPI002F94AD85
MKREQPSIPSPPRFAKSFLAWFCPPALYEGIEGDLLEEFDQDVALLGERIARKRFILNVLRFFRPGIVLRNKLSWESTGIIMIGNYIKVASRNIAKRKLYSFINAFGLSVAIAFCTLIYLFVQDEKSFDQFQVNKERIYRIHDIAFSPERFKKKEDPYERFAHLPGPLGDAVLRELPEVEYMTRFSEGGEGVMRYQDKVFRQNYISVDSGFFSMFSFSILAGDKAHLFRNISDAVLTQETARKYFGDEDPIGKMFTIDISGEKTMRVAAIIQTPPPNSSIDFEMIVPIEANPWFVRNRDRWSNYSYPTFIQVRPGTSEAALTAQLNRLYDKYIPADSKKWRERDLAPGYKAYEYGVTSLQDIHLRNDVDWHKVSDPQYSWILGGIALLILVIACINYISLAMTTSVSRRIEVGIRKVIGAYRTQLVQQFGFESITLAMVSMVIGLGLVGVFLPFFNEFTGKYIELSLLTLLQVAGVALVLAVIVGFMAGIYPSLYLSGFLPALVLKGGFTSRLHAGFTRPLVVFQFFLSASMVICSIIMFRQMKYITTKDLGFDKEHVLVIGTQTGWNKDADRSVEQFRNATKGDAVVQQVAGANFSFNGGWSRNGFKINGEDKNAFVYRVDPEYIPLLNIQLKAGRNFDERIASDSNALIVNEALVKEMNWKDPLNEHLNWKEDSVGPGYKIIGVVKDYHFLSLKRQIDPMFLSINQKDVGYTMSIMVKMSAGDLSANVEHIRKIWTSLFPDRPFVYSFVDEDVARQYESHTRWMNIMGLSTAFAIIIACLGLFGLAGINALNRTKEIGIRKVMGADLRTIFILLNKQYIWLALIAFGAATPVSWYIMTKWWLTDFQFKVEVGWELFAISTFSGLALAIFTVSYHAIKAALINPAVTLKYE